MYETCLTKLYSSKNIAQRSALYYPAWLAAQYRKKRNVFFDCFYSKLNTGKLKNAYLQPLDIT